jgi:hypothetical protein
METDDVIRLWEISLKLQRIWSLFWKLSVWFLTKTLISLRLIVVSLSTSNRCWHSAPGLSMSASIHSAFQVTTFTPAAGHSWVELSAAVVKYSRGQYKWGSEMTLGGRMFGEFSVDPGSAPLVGLAFIYSVIHLFIHSTMTLQPFLGPQPLFQVRNRIRSSVGLLRRGIGPFQGRYIYMFLLWL